ncbi:MAG: class I SAM-dependent methyltransferase [Capsulimonas sp.]|uniref:class I SAM-dependent methyltransferase n=1 Tax=Capsulimonas sp. TaxID=2494211 RepID=UPI0032645BD4
MPTSTNINESNISRQSYDPDHFAPLFEAEDRHFWFRSRNTIISALTEQIVAPLGEGYRVLEVGCGTGNVLRRLSSVCTGGSVIGMDLFIEGLAFARTRTSAPLVQGDVYHSPFSAEFDMIGLFDVVEHIEDDGRVFNSLYGLLKPGGSLFVTVPAHMSLWSYFDTASHHCRRYEIPELTERLAQAGFEIEYVTEFMTALYPLVWLGRRMAAMIRGDKKITAEDAHQMSVNELRIVPLVNDLLTWALQGDVKRIKGRHQLSRGTSILALARKKT